MSRYDFIIAGAGLAGACAALRLSAHGSVLVVEKRFPAAGGSGAGAGLVNPILGMRARPVWRIDEALQALDDTVAAAGAGDLYHRSPTLRPAYGSDQIDRFRRTAHARPKHATWISAHVCPERFPDVVAPEGGLLIHTGGTIDLSGLVRRLLAAATDRGAIVRSGVEMVGWNVNGALLSDRDHVRRRGRAAASHPDEQMAFPPNEQAASHPDKRASSHPDRHEHVDAARIILAIGPGYRRFPELTRLRLHQVKGQTIRLARPAGLAEDLPHLAGRGYVAHDGDSVLAGSTYQHTFDHVRPTRRHSEIIRRKVAEMLPALAEAELLEERVGVRVTVPGIRLPMVGPIPGGDNVWIFTAFGAKGLLTAPLAAMELPDQLSDPARIHPQLRVRTAVKQRL